MIAVVNYGLGNLHSVQKAISFVGGEALVTDDPETILLADKVVLPGVGAFADGMAGLRSRDLISLINEVADAGKPLLGICLGMQLLFESSDEGGSHSGLGLLPGQVKGFRGPDLKIPQIGWNQLAIHNQETLLAGLEQGNYVYFNHGYYCEPENKAEILASTTYGVQFAAAVQRDHIFGVQFHPEKSQRIGLKIIRNFVEI
jgi:glutamine amidotransferase